MNLLIAVDWSEESFEAVKVAGAVFPDPVVTLVHAVDLRPFESPLLAPTIARQAYAEFKVAMRDAGTKVLEQCSSLLPQSVARPRHVLETGEPAKIVLDAANSTKADVIALGTRNRNRLTEVALGSVSHRVVLHAPCATFLVKRPVPDQPRVLLAVEQYDDARSMVEWLTSHPFSRPITVTVFSVAATPQLADPLSLPVFLNWEAEARAAARKLVDDIAQQLKDAGHPATVKVASGDPGRAIHQESTQHDLLIVGSHGRKGLERFLLGSVSHAAVHGSACSVLILRTP